MFDEDGSSGKRRDEVDICMVEEVVVLALKSCMGLLLDLKYNVTRLNSRSLIALASEVNLVTCAHTPINVDVEHLPLNNGLLATASLASILFSDDFSFSIAVGADGLETLDHRTHLAHHCLHAVAITASALLDGTFFSATSVTFWTNDRLLQG